MKLKLKRTLAFALAFMMSISSVAFADGTKVGTDGKGKTPIWVEQEATNFDVVIPLSFDLFMGGDGKVVSATNPQIINKSFGPIQVENISVTSKNGWSIIDINSDKSKLKIDSKQIGFQLNDIITTPAFDFTTSNESWVINGNNNAKDLTYGGIMSPTRNGFDKTNAIDTIFTIDWYAEEVITPVVPEYKVGDKLTKSLTGLDNFDFTCVEVDDANAYFICDEIVSEQAFNSDVSKDNDYATSDLKTYVDGLGVEGLIIPTKEQLEKWYPNQSDRIAQYNGDNGYYWTSSAYPDRTDRAYRVRGDGFVSGAGVNVTLGVRPCFAVAK